MTEKLNSAMLAHIRAAIRKEFTAFFVTMTTANDKGWPKVDDTEFLDALADSMMEMGKQRGLGTALLQTFVHELQDRINNSVNK